MPAIVISDVGDKTLALLRQRAVAHGRSPEAEAKAIIEEELQAALWTWDQVNLIRSQLQASNRSFGDSAELLSEDRGR